MIAVRRLGAVMVLTAAMVMTACSSSTTGSSTPATSSTTTTTRPVPPPGGSVAWLELDSTEVAAGGFIRGTVVVLNDTGAPIGLSCGIPYSLGIETPFGLETISVTSACSFHAPMAIGESRWPVVARAAYELCSDQPSATKPTCLSGHIPPPLPTGPTRAVVIRTGVSTAIPLPAPETITIR